MDGRQNKYLQALRQITQEVSSEHDLISAMSKLVKHIRKTTESDCCSLYLSDDFRKRYHLVASDGLSQQAVGKASLKYGEGLVGVVGQSNEILNLADAPAHPNFKYLPEVGEDEYLSFLGVPILNQGDKLGVLVVQSRYRQIFGEQEESFMVTLSAQIGSIIAQTKQEDDLAQDQLQRIKGTASTGGVAIAKAMVFQPEISLDEIQVKRCDDALLQIELFNQAMFQLQLEMDRAALKMQEDDKNRAIVGYMASYGRLLDDATFQDEVSELIERNNYLATSAVKIVIERRLKDAKEQGQEDKVIDLTDFAQVLLARLSQASNSNRGLDLSESVILVVENLPAAMLAQVPSEKIVGFIATSQISSAHTSILARDLGIPSILGVKLNLAEVDGHMVVINGRNCEVILDPPESVQDEFKQLVNQNKEQNDLFYKEALLSAECLDKVKINIGLNAGLNLNGYNQNSIVNLHVDNSPHPNKEQFLVNEADCVGLFRTEIAFMLCSTFPSEQQQYEWYARQLEQFAPKSVVMRTLDVGSDKGLSYLPSKEENPALGWRGVRITNDMPNILYTQLRAMLKAHMKYHNLQIMVPMVSRLEEVLFVKNAINEVARELEYAKNNIALPQFGVMIEVPSCIYLMADLAKEVDFFSIGSNDLVQYLLAIDRANPKVNRFYDSFNPSVVRCLYQLQQEAQQYNKPINVCGELAGDPLGVLLLLSLGYTSLSMNYSYIAKIKYILRRVSFSQLQNLGQNALKLTQNAKIRDLYEKYAHEQGLSCILELAQSQSENDSVKSTF